LQEDSNNFNDNTARGAMYQDSFMVFVLISYISRTYILFFIMEGSIFINGRRSSARIIAKSANAAANPVAVDNANAATAVAKRTPTAARTARTARTTRTTRTSPGAARTARTASTTRTSPGAARAARTARISPGAARAARTARTSPGAARTARTARTSPGAARTSSSPKAAMVAIAASSSSPKSLTHTSSTSAKPNSFLDYRLQTYEFMKNIQELQELQELNYYLDIEKLLANIEPDATGIVCLSNPKKKPKKNFKFAIKIAANITQDSTKEIYILEQMIPFIRMGYHNLPMLYQAFKGVNKALLLESLKTTQAVKNSVGLFMENNKKYTYYNIYANEYASGDLKKFLNAYGKDNSSISQELVENAVAQIIMAIATLHDLGIRHNDTHHGNFLYHEIKPGGYIKYIIQGKTYYVENLGYLWVIWDFGISTQLNGPYDYFKDYEMLSLYLRKKNKMYNMHFDATHKDQNPAASRQKGKPTRRQHGHLEFDKAMPSSVVGLENILYNFSKVKKDGTYLDPAMSFESEDDLMRFLASKNAEDKKIVTDLSLYHSIKDENENYISDEGIFLREHLFRFLPAISQKPVLDEEQILFEINLQLDKIVSVEKKHGNKFVTDYDETLKKYQGKKIFLPEIFKKK
jgi:hypothetical protein